MSENIVDVGTKATPFNIENCSYGIRDMEDKIIPKYLLDEITSIHYFTGIDGQLGAYKRNNDVYLGGMPTDLNIEPLTHLHFCVIVKKNGLTAVAAESDFSLALKVALDHVDEILAYR